MKYNITLGYSSKLNLTETLEGVSDIKTSIFNSLKNEFKLIELSSSIITNKSLWLNDDFQLTERPIDFDIKNDDYGQLMQSNNKWRRYMLYRFGIDKPGKGIITNFSAVRRDGHVSNNSSLIYEEVGCEIVSKKHDEEEINKYCVSVYKHLLDIDNKISKRYAELSSSHFSETLSFVTYKQLQMLYPILSLEERLNKFGKENGNFVLVGFVSKMFGQKNRTPYSEDVFDFKYFSKIYIFNRTIEKTISIGYVSYQVDKNALKEQNTILKENWKSSTEYNYLIKENKLPLTVSIGIHINRITMAILEKQHIGEVHSSIWEDEFINYCKINGIEIL